MDEKDPISQINSDLLESDLVTIDQVLPKQLYIIPIRYRPIFPGIITPPVAATSAAVASINVGPFDARSRTLRWVRRTVCAAMVWTVVVWA